MQEQCTCSLCGSPIVRRRPNQRRRYCSRQCYHTASRAVQPENYWPNVLKSEACWRWTGQIAANGYGRLGSGPHRRTAHNVAWEIASGEPIPAKHIIGHTCDNRPCVRNDDEGVYEVDGSPYRRLGHLWLATHAANMKDMAQKRRAASGERNGRYLHPESILRGEAHANSKLTAEGVLQIRAEYAAGDTSLSILGARYGVTPQSIATVVKRKLWRHI